MAGQRRAHLPNIITIARIAVCPVIYWLMFTPSVTHKFVAFFLFLAAALSDLWDGYLARKYGWITDLGKLLDPVADKLLLATTWVPFFILSHRSEAFEIPYIGPMPLWIMIVIFGREIGITIFRSYAQRQGVVIAAGQSGKYKAFIQNLFTGGLMLWYALSLTAESADWAGPVWSGWSVFHGLWCVVTLAVALVLTVYSMGVYLWQYRAVVQEH